MNYLFTLRAFYFHSVASHAVYDAIIQSEIIEYVTRSVDILICIETRDTHDNYQLQLIIIDSSLCAFDDIFLFLVEITQHPR